MRYMLIATALLAGCATTYQGPKISQVVDMCYAEGYAVRNLSRCVEKKLDSYQANWYEDRDYPAVASWFSYNNLLGMQVSEGVLVESEARMKSFEYLQNLRNQKYIEQAQRQAASAAMVNAGVGMMGVQQQIRANEINQYNSTRPRTCTYQQVGATIQQVCN